MKKTTSRTRSEAARRAARTRKARDTFARTNPRAYDVLSMLAQGWTSDEVAEELGMSVRTVAAYRANATRFAYTPLLEECRF